jgi:hypothetical protein
MLVWREAAVEQGQLFESNVVNLTKFRERRQSRAGDVLSSQFPVKPRPLSMRSIAHQARMLAHLMGTGNRERGTAGS